MPYLLLFYKIYQILPNNINKTHNNLTISNNLSNNSSINYKIIAINSNFTSQQTNLLLNLKIKILMKINKQ